jgi:hypothetical protein
MKKVVMFVLAVLLSVVFVSTGFTQDKPATAPEKIATTDAKDVKAPAPKAEKLRVRGEVVSADSAAKTMVVKSRKGEMTFDVTGAKFGRNYKIEDAKAGDRIVIAYDEVDGKMVAKYVGKQRHHGKKHPKKARTGGAEAKPTEAPATPAK